MSGIEDVAKLSDGQLKDTMIRIREDQDAAKAEAHRVVGLAKKELEAAVTGGRPKQVVDALTARLLDIKTIHDSRLEAVNKQLATLQLETARRAHVQEETNEATLKADLRRRYVQAGGRLADFEAAYPELRRQELTRRTLQPDHDPDAERRARSYRTRL